jgi:predicted AAA+ superfamily ATPase
MKRVIYNQFESWLQSKRRKPLILQGARQVGKTYFIEHLLLKTIGKLVKFDFIEDKTASSIFEGEVSDPLKLVQKIERHKNVKINLAEDIIFLDEVQECPTALQSLKYFAIKLPQLKIIAAGSFLGLMSRETSFPIGYVDFFSMGPLSFFEFILNYNSELADFYKELNPIDVDIVDPFYHKKLLDLFRTYLALGGLPEVISVFLSEYQNDLNQALSDARKVQKSLLRGYQADFAKHSGVVNAAHILHVFDAIPTQLAQYQDESVNKFKFSKVIPNNSGLNKIVGPLEWLEKARLVIKVSPCSKAIEPLKAYTKSNIFKLYFFDVGLLQASLNLPIEAIIDQQLGSYKGYIAENFVASELFSAENEALCSWNEGEAEIEFLIHHGKNIVPIEVKSSANFLRAKSLDSFIGRYKPKAAIKLAPLNRGYNKDKNIHTVPIYLAGKLIKPDQYT